MKINSFYNIMFSNTYPVFNKFIQTTKGYQTGDFLAKGIPTATDSNYRKVRKLIFKDASLRKQLTTNLMSIYDYGIHHKQSTLLYQSAGSSLLSIDINHYKYYLLVCNGAMNLDLRSPHPNSVLSQDRIILLVNYLLPGECESKITGIRILTDVRNFSYPFYAKAFQNFTIINTYEAFCQFALLHKIPEMTRTINIPFFNNFIQSIQKDNRASLMSDGIHCINDCTYSPILASSYLNYNYIVYNNIIILYEYSHGSLPVQQINISRFPNDY